MTLEQPSVAHGPLSVPLRHALSKLGAVALAYMETKRVCLVQDSPDRPNSHNPYPECSMAQSGCRQRDI